MYIFKYNIITKDYSKHIYKPVTSSIHKSQKSNIYKNEIPISSIENVHGIYYLTHTKVISLSVKKEGIIWENIEKVNKEDW